MRLPAVTVFDVNETLSDLSGMSFRFAEIGAPREEAALWFATVLRDGFALAAAGGSERFATIAEDLLRLRLRDQPLNTDIEPAVAHVLSGFAELSLHPDVVPGVSALHAAGRRLVTLSNGSTSVADRLFRTAGIREMFDALLSVEDTSRWKPAREAYEYAANACGVGVGEMMLVAVHPWDIHGADAAGLQTVWVNRSGGPYPPYFAAPLYEVRSLEELARLG